MVKNDTIMICVLYIILYRVYEWQYPFLFVTHEINLYRYNCLNYNNFIEYISDWLWFG